MAFCSEAFIDSIGLMKAPKSTSATPFDNPGVLRAHINLQLFFGMAAANDAAIEYSPSSRAHILFVHALYASLSLSLYIYIYVCTYLRIHAYMRLHEKVPITCFGGLARSSMIVRSQSTFLADEIPKHLTKPESMISGCVLMDEITKLE